MLYANITHTDTEISGVASVGSLIHKCSFALWLILLHTYNFAGQQKIITLFKHREYSVGLFDCLVVALDHLCGRTFTYRTESTFGSASIIMVLAGRLALALVVAFSGVSSAARWPAHKAIGISK